MEYRYYGGLLQGGVERLEDARVIDRLSKDLSDEFPEMKGFSPRNLGSMKKFASCWTDQKILQQVVAKFPFQRRAADHKRLNCRLVDIRDTITIGKQLSRWEILPMKNGYWEVVVTPEDRA